MSANPPRIYTLSETAKLHDMSKGYLSRCLKEGKEAKGYDLRPYAAYDTDGHVKHFAFPDDYDFPAAGEAASENSTEETSRELVPTDSPARTHPAPTEVSGTEPITVEIYERKDWLSHREAIKLMAAYLPIDYEYESMRYSNISRALGSVAVDFKRESTNVSPREESYHLEGKVLAVIRQIQQEGLHDAIWTIEGREWQKRIHEALGLGKENGFDVEPHMR